jgi:hypothetical protein
MAKTEQKQPEDFVTFGDGYADIELSSEIEIGGVKVKTVRMREPTVADQMLPRKGTDAEFEVAVFANICSITPKEVQSMSIRSYKRLQAAFFGLTD